VIAMNKQSPSKSDITVNLFGCVSPPNTIVSKYNRAAPQ